MGGPTSFAQRQLSKHGWKSGKGLGKSEDGMSQAIKVDLKADTKGIGATMADFNWWDHLFNKASQNIQVQRSEEGEVVIQRKKEEFHITTSRPKKAVKALLYGSFVKASVKTEDSGDESDEDTKVYATIKTDEELLAACGGRTAHKAARHGHKLKGKLKRVKDELTISKKTDSDSENPSDSDSDSDSDDSDKKSEKKQMKARLESSSDSESDSEKDSSAGKRTFVQIAPPTHTHHSHGQSEKAAEVEEEKEKKKKKKKKKSEGEVEEEAKKEKKKRRKSESDDEDIEEDEKKEKKRKKEKK
eukprot:Colp12_sorted_trinity150504_noHs@13972